MKKHWIALSAVTALGLLNISAASAGVGVSVSIGQPGFYGQLDIGDYYPRPQLVFAEPRVVFFEPAYRYAPPIYLRVPPGHRNKWSRYCGNYGACGRPVYFVQDNWYSNVYAPRYTSFHRHGDDGHRYDRDYWDRNDRRGGDRHGANRGPGRGDNGPDRGRGNHGGKQGRD